MGTFAGWGHLKGQGSLPTHSAPSALAAPTRVLQRLEPPAVPHDRDGSRVWSRSGTTRPVGAVCSSGGWTRDSSGHRERGHRSAPGTRNGGTGNGDTGNGGTGQLRAPGTGAGRTAAAPAKGSWGILPPPPTSSGEYPALLSWLHPWVGTLAGRPRCPAQRGIVCPAAGCPPRLRFPGAGRAEALLKSPFMPQPDGRTGQGSGRAHRASFMQPVKGEGERAPGPAVPGAADPHHSHGTRWELLPERGISAQSTPKCRSKVPSY